MASRGRPKAELVVTEEERETLTRWARRRKSAQALALRSRIVLGCAEGLSNKEVAARERVSQPTVGKWRRRVRRGALRRVGRRTTAGPAGVGDRRAGRGRGGGHAGIGPRGRHALVAQVDGPALRVVQVDDRADLEG